MDLLPSSDSSVDDSTMEFMFDTDLFWKQADLILLEMITVKDSRLHCLQESEIHSKFKVFIWI